VSHGAKVINLSLFSGIQGVASFLPGPCNNAFAAGSLCVIASGNSGEDQGSGLPSDINALVVTANDDHGGHAQFGQKPDTKWGVSAPGWNVLSTWPQNQQSSAGRGLSYEFGTSMAAPLVAGAAALLFAAGFNNKQVVDKLLATAGPARNPTLEGAGIINVARALGVSTDEPAPPSTVRSVAGPGGIVVPTTRPAGGASTATTVVVPTTRRPVRADVDANFTDDLAQGKVGLGQALAKRNSKENVNMAGPMALTLVGLGVIGFGWPAATWLRRRRVPAPTDLPPAV
jgi:subtilisin family serine protease